MVHNGLSDQQVLVSRSTHGEKKVEDKSKSGILAAVLTLVKEPMLILLIVAAAIYFLTGSQGEGLFMVGAIIVISAISIYSRNALAELNPYYALDYGPKFYFASNCLPFVFNARRRDLSR